MRTLPDGTVITTDENGNINSVNGKPGTRIPGSGPVSNGGRTNNDVSATNAGINLDFVDFGSLVAPFVDFSAAFDFATNVGRDNRDTYYRNLTSEQSRNAALNLVDTDIEGINRGLDALLPRARQEGERDLDTNISRAGQIDTFNFSRIPQFNSFNRGQVSQNNEFNRAERERSIAASGIDYRDRVTQILEQLADQSEGRLSDPLLDTLTTRTNRNRGADIGAASGISSLSGAGINIQDKLDADQRIGLALDAQKTLPTVAAQAQSILQPPEEFLRTTTAVPTNVPLNVSNFQDRIPIQSNISAGAAQQQIGTQATEYETIPAETALGSRLQTDQFNEQSAYNRDLAVLNAEQAQLTAQDSEDLRVVQQDKFDSQAAAQLDAYYAGLDQRTREAELRAGASLGGAALTGGAGLLGTLGNIASGAGSVAGGILDAGLKGYDAIFGDGDGRVTVGGTEISSAGIADWVKGWFGGDSAADAATGGNYDQAEYPGVSIPPDASGIAGPSTSTGQGISAPAIPSSGNLPEAFRPAIEPLVRQDAETVVDSAVVASNWSGMTPSQQIQSSANIGTRVAESRGFLPQGSAQTVRNVGNDLSVLANPETPEAQRAAAVASLTSQALNTRYTGDVSNPNSIGGVPVVDRITGADGNTEFQLADGSTVPQSEVMATANTTNAINAFSVLTSQADTETKLAALTGIGINSPQAQEILTQYTAGNTNAALALFNTGRNFNQMNPVEQAASLIQTSNLTYSALAQNIAPQAAANTGASTFFSAANTASGAISSVAPFIPAAVQYADTIKNKTIPVLRGDMSYADALSSQLPGLKMLGVDIGGGKSAAGEMRSGWRKNLVSMGIADEEQNVTLADGTKFALNNNEKPLINADGTERNTYEIEVGDKVAANAIPDAHIFAIATGLDPTSSSKGGTFDKITGQLVNAATSNASTPEEVKANFKAMMGNMDPGQVASRVEILRATNKISDQEYGVYVDRINKMFGTEFQPVDRAKSVNTLVAGLKQLGDSVTKEQKQLLKDLTDTRRLESNRRRVNDRLGLVEV